MTTTCSGGTAVRVSVNGAPLHYDAGISVAELLAHQGLAMRRVAVERNGEIVPRSRHAETRVSDGDCIEIVIAVGGG